MRFRFATLLAVGAFTLAACSSTPEPQPVPVQPAPAPAPVAASFGSLEEELRAQVGDRVFFDFDRSDLRPDARAVTESFGAWLQARPQVTTVIEGHTDERGTRAYNLALGERRANSVKRYLGTLGVASNRVSTVSFGEERPAVTGSTEYAWALNRNAQFVVRQ
ncbi:MAG: peptidoglycan-associated lipoprotein Pal [Rhodospirillales bacterium]